MRARTMFGMAFLGTLAFTGCSDDEGTEMIASSNSIVPSFLYVDVDGNAIGTSTAAETEIYKAYAVPETEPPEIATVPVLDPAGAPVTWGDFSAATGTIDVSCVDEGTRVEVSYEGLLPEGVYTSWVLYFTKPGFDFTSPSFDNLAGFSALGPIDGSESMATASSAGAASLDTVVPSGAVGNPVVDATDVPDCLLTDWFEFHVILAYHIDGETCGPSPCGDDTIAEQVAFAFKEGASVL